MPSEVWRNFARNQVVEAEHIVRPKTLAELQATLREVSRRKGRVKAVATGLSFSDILQTKDTLIVLTELLASPAPHVLLPLEDELFHVALPFEPRVRVIAGAPIRDLNVALLKAGLAFSNLGGYDAQTMIGAISTSTHGTGLTLGPLPNAVRSLDLVTTDGVMYRIEPEKGITDPAKFKARYGTTMTLVQRDDWFNAARVSLGCMGVIYSAVMAVQPAYRLHEHRRLEAWSSLKNEMAGRAAQFRHFEVDVNPYRRSDNHDHMCLVTERSIAPPDAKKIPRPPSVVSAEKLVFLETTQKGVIDLSNATPRIVPFLLEQGLETLVSPPEGHLDESYVIHNVGLINKAKVLSGEYFVPIDRIDKAVDKLIGVMANNRQHGIYQTGPLAVRFIAPSDAYLSMANGRVSCSIEVALFIEGAGTIDALDSYEQALSDLGSRPHWAQMHQLTGARGWAMSAYPKMQDWLNVYGQLNAKGIFNNAFTDRLGISIS